MYTHVCKQTRDDQLTDGWVMFAMLQTDEPVPSGDFMGFLIFCGRSLEITYSGKRKEFSSTTLRTYSRGICYEFGHLRIYAIS